MLPCPTVYIIDGSADPQDVPYAAIDEFDVAFEHALRPFVDSADADQGLSDLLGLLVSPTAEKDVRKLVAGQDRAANFGGRDVQVVYSITHIVGWFTSLRGDKLSDSSRVVAAALAGREEYGEPVLSASTLTEAVTSDELESAIDEAFAGFGWELPDTDTVQYTFGGETVTLPVPAE